MSKLFGATSIILASLTLFSCTKDAARTPQGTPPPPVTVAQAVRRTVPVSLSGIGNVESVASVQLHSQVAGQILEVHIADGADVVKGQLLFTIDPAPFAIAHQRAEAQLARDKALLKKAEDDQVRFQKLVEQQLVSEADYEAAAATAASLAGTIQADQAAVNDAALSLSYCRITSPITGRAGSINLRAGNLVKVNDDPPLVTLLQVKPVYVTFSFPEKYLPAVREHQAEGRLAVTAKNRAEIGAGHAGTLTFIDNTVDVTTGTIRLKAQFPNDDRGLWPGQFVDVTVTLSEQKDALIVPSAAIQVGQQGSYVFVVAADGTAQVKPVVIDRALGDDTVLASGLDGGETVITDGQIRVVPGGKVAVTTKS
jgi:multidrug efflux system membrane fusion protein